MTQLNGFVNLTQLRKLTQQTLKPIVHEIQEQMSKIKKQSQFLKEQSQKSSLMFQKQKKFQQYMLLNQQQMRDVKIKLQELKDEDIKSMLTTKKQISSINVQIEAMKKQRIKYEEMINKQKKENDRILANFNKYQIWMDQKVQTMNEQYLKLKKDTLQMTAYVKSDYQKTSFKFKELQQTIQKKILSNEKKFSILELYLTQRQEIKRKLIQLQEKFANYAPNQKIQYLRNCQIKQLQMNKSEINIILDTYLPPQVKQMLPQIQERVKQIDKMNDDISDIKSNVFESQQEIIHFKQSTESLQSNFRRQFKEINQNITTNIESLKTDVRVALAIDEKQTQQRKKFEKLFSNQIHSFVQKQNEKTYKKMQQQTFSKLDQRHKQQESKLSEKQQILDRKCAQMKQISDNIENLLASYNNRIIKIRSDTELFKNQLMKQMKSLQNMKNESNERFEDIGKIMANLIQIMTINLTLDANLDRNCIRSDNFAFATYNDGLIYQVVPFNTKQGQKNNLNKLTYRRVQLQIPHLRRSVLSSIVTLIDQIYQSYPYLYWSSYKPSNFFKQQILQHYKVQFQKYGSLFANNDRNIPNEFDSNGFSKRHDNQSHLFTRSKISEKAYTPLRKENQTITISQMPVLKINEGNYSDFQELGDTINENIQLNAENNSSGIQLTDYQKQNIKRAMRTIHEIHPRDSSSNRFVLSGLANRSSLSKQANLTIDQIPQSAGGPRKRYLAKSKKQLRYSRYQNNEVQTYMTSRSTRRTTSIGNYKF